MTVRLLYLVGQLVPRGSERQLYYLVRGLKHRQLAPAVCVWNYAEDDAYVARLKALDIPVLPLPHHGSRLQKLIAFRRIVRDLRPEVVHSYSFYTNGAVAFALRGLPILGVGSVRNNFLLDRAQSGPWMSRLNARWPRRQIYNSQNAFDNAQRHGGLFRPGLCRVVRNGIDLGTFRPAAGPSGGVLRILGVGWLVPFKRWDRLIRAAAALKAQGLAFTMQIVGEGPLRGDLEAQIGAAGLQDGVALPGYLADIPAAMQAADMLVHPSEAEGCPNAVMEAMACGLPVVANRVGDNPYLVEEGETGFLVDSGDEAALVDRMTRLMEQPALRARMGARSRAVAEKTFGLDRFVEATLAAYVEMGWKAPAYPR